MCVSVSFREIFGARSQAVEWKQKIYGKIVYRYCLAVLYLLVAQYNASILVICKHAIIGKRPKRKNAKFISRKVCVSLSVCNVL